MTLFLSTDESCVYSLIAGRDSSRPIPLAEICQATGLSARAVKGIVEALRVDGEPIGASRGKPSGYYLARSVEELESSARQLVNQAKRELLSASRLLGKKRVRELLGQNVL